MKKRKGILTGLFATCAACLISAASYSQSTQASNKPLAEIPLATMSVQYIIVETDGAIGMTKGRARASAAALLGLVSLVIGGLALARAAGRIGAGNGRVVAFVALVLGLIAMILGVVHLGTSTGGFGTGSGRAGAIVALVLGLIGTNLGGLALARSRRERA